MSARVRETWARRQAEGGRALIPFVTAGFPRRSATIEILRAAADAGCDLIELGVPFSDPLADGPAIQHTSQVAISRGVTLPWILSCVAKARRHVDVPIVLMGYYNPFYSYGLERFCRDAAAAGVDGLIVPDLPPDESADLRRAAGAHDLSLVFLIAPTTTDARVRAVARASTDFCYCVSVTGVTGARRAFAAHTDIYLRRVRRLIRKPVVVGFGVSTPAHVRRLGRWANGVVVGSALVPVLEQAGSNRGLARGLRRFLKPLVQAAHDL